MLQHAELVLLQRRHPGTESLVSSRNRQGVISQASWVRNAETRNDRKASCFREFQLKNTPTQMASVELSAQSP